MLSAALLLTGCASRTNEKQETELSSENCAIKLPKGWQDAQGGLNQNAVLEAADMDKKQYFIVIEEPKGETPVTLSDYMKLIQINVAENLDKIQMSAPEQTQIGGMDALQIKTSGTLSGTEVEYSIFVVDGGELFYQLVGWTQAGKTEDAAAVFSEIAASFQKTD